MKQEDLDRAIYESMIDIWGAYRKSTTSQDASFFNKVFANLYLTSVNKTHRHFIDHIAMALAPAINCACNGGKTDEEE